jgi:tripartite-type tricarboxylate transporter receptor subunit TctC
MKKILWISVMSIVLTINMAPISYAAGDYPNRPITIICPFTAGGLADFMARTFAMSAQKYLGQPLVVVNKPGAGSLIGSLAVAQAAPDGYTLLLTHAALTGSMASEIAQGRKPPFSRNDFTALGSFTKTTGCKVVAYDHPWKTMADLIRECKAKPNHYTYSSSGAGGSIWLEANLFFSATGIKVREIPYKGGGEVLTSVMGRHADFTIGGVSIVRPLAEAKKLRILSIAREKRIKSLPDVPTLEEFGVHNANFFAWTGLFVRSKTPNDIVGKLKEVAEKVAKEKEFIDTVEKTGDEVAYMNGDEFANHWELESEMIAKLYERLAKEKPLN